MGSCGTVDFAARKGWDPWWTAEHPGVLPGPWLRTEMCSACCETAQMAALFGKRFWPQENATAVMG